MHRLSLFLTTVLTTKLGKWVATYIISQKYYQLVI